MKQNIRFIIVLSILIILMGCSKSITNSIDSPDHTESIAKYIIGEIFRAGMAWNSNAKALKSTNLAGTIPINIQVDDRQYSPEGGYIHVSGSVTGAINFNDDTGAITGGYVSIEVNETLADYGLRINNNLYTVNGAPYVSCAGHLTIMPGGLTFGTASSFSIGGGIRTVGPNYDETINYQITIIINSSGTGGHVSGVIRRQPPNRDIDIDYTY